MRKYLMILPPIHLQSSNRIVNHVLALLIMLRSAQLKLTGLREQMRFREQSVAVAATSDDHEEIHMARKELRDNVKYYVENLDGQKEPPTGL